jgi:hypothetical protein
MIDIIKKRTYPSKSVGEHDGQFAVVFNEQRGGKVPNTSISYGLSALCDHDSVDQSEIHIVSHHMAMNKSNQVLLYFRLQNRQGRVSKLCVPMLTLKVDDRERNTYRRNVWQTDSRLYVF